MELSTKFKDLKEKRELVGGKTGTETEYFPSKMPNLIFVSGVKLLKWQLSSITVEVFCACVALIFIQN